VAPYLRNSHFLTRPLAKGSTFHLNVKLVLHLQGSSHMDVSAGGDINEQVKRVISAHKTMDGISINEIKQTLSHLSSVDVM